MPSYPKSETRSQIFVFVLAISTAFSKKRYREATLLNYLPALDFATISMKAGLPIYLKSAL